ncbi:MAG: hypothetical protein HY078_07055 [Elusimicrobia bacterium]|nr:hypothetical protein [Elusimicrobiota bacterium]
MNRKLLCALALAATVSAAIAQTKTPLVTVRLFWEYHGLPAGMKVYEVKQGGYPVWLTGVVQTLSDAPVGKEIESGTLFAKAGEAKRFVLVYKNPTNKMLRFFTNPHQISPPTVGLGFVFQCTCINHLFSVPPNRYWYRVVQFRLTPDFQGTSLDVKHHLAARAAASSSDDRLLKGVVKPKLDHFPN